MTETPSLVAIACTNQIKLIRAIEIICSTSNGIILCSINNGTMKKIGILILTIVVVLIAGFYFFNSFIYNQKQSDPSFTSNYKQAEFRIDSEAVIIGDTLQYFGNELVTDLNDDGRDDVVFLVTHSPGGSGTFFYVVAALAGENGYRGSDGYLLGDRISPQTINNSVNPKHQNVVVVNYADRNPGEPMTTSPSLGKSVYLKMDVDDRWGIVEPDFSGEASPDQMDLRMKTWVWQRALYNDGREIVPKDADTFTIIFNEDGSFSATTDCNSVGGTYTVLDKRLILTDIFSTLMYCEAAQEAEFIQLLESTSSFFLTGQGELILELKYDSGTATFR